MLAGLKVVEFATYIAAPGAGGLLADWGAEVIKVERPGGDPIRLSLADAKSDMGANPIFELDNRGKRGVALDIGKPAGREALIKLASRADVFLTNVRPAALKRAGLDEAALRAVNPRLVYALVTGYGLEGPDAHRPGFDVAAFWARAGLAQLMPPKGTDPFILRTGVGDHVCSLATVSAIMAALYERERTGKGRFVETSLLGTGIYAIGSDLAVQLRFGRLASTRPRKAPVEPLSNSYRSAEGRWFMIALRGGSPEWPAVAAAAGRAELIDDPRFKTGRDRRAHAAELVAELDAGFGALPWDELSRRLDEADLVWAPVQTAAEVAADPQAHATGRFVEVEDGAGGTFLSPASPVSLPGEPAPPRPAAPAVGQHTREILAAAGYAPAAIDAMFAEGAAA